MTDRDAPLIVDTHVHVRSADDAQYPLAPTGVGSDWWQDGDRSTEALLAQLDAGGVARTVLVQAVGVYGYDNSYVIDSVALAPDRCTVVGAVDLDDPTVLEQIERLAGHPCVRGIRVFGMTPEAHWIGTPVVADAFAAAAQTGLTVVVTVPGDQLAAMRTEILGATAPIVLDHCGFPDYEDGLIARDQATWSFVDAEHVSLKVTTHSFEHAAATRPGADDARLMTALAERFGATRLMWGSDYPQTARDDYPGLVARAFDAVRDLDDADRAAVLGGTATRLFGTEDSAPSVASVRAALERLRRTLAADDFELIVQSVGGGVATLDVVAGAEACADCLVPQAVFTAIAGDQLAIAYPDSPLGVAVGSYPSDH